MCIMFEVKGLGALKCNMTNGESLKFLIFASGMLLTIENLAHWLDLLFVCGVLTFVRSKFIHLNGVLYACRILFFISKL